MTPCQVRILDDSTRVCVCHGDKAKWAGQFYCIAKPIAVDWVEFQRQQTSKDNGA